MSKKIALEALASVVQRGFTNTAIKQDLAKVEERLSDRIQGVRDEVLTLKVDMIKLNQFERRVSRLETELARG